jgi:hypothetical protein
MNFKLISNELIIMSYKKLLKEVVMRLIKEKINVQNSKVDLNDQSAASAAQAAASAAASAAAV